MSNWKNLEKNKPENLEGQLFRSSITRRPVSIMWAKKHPETTEWRDPLATKMGRPKSTIKKKAISAYIRAEIAEAVPNTPEKSRSEFVEEAIVAALKKAKIEVKLTSSDS